MQTKFILAALLGGAALAAGAQTRDPVPLQQSQSGAAAQNPRVALAQPADSDDVKFLTDALRTSLAEVQMGELPAQRGSMPAVREFGAKLTADHAASAREIRGMLETMNATVPSEPSVEAQGHHTALARLSGAEFDTAFLTLMIESHEAAIEAYSAQTHANPNEQLKDFAQKSLPTLREHLGTAISLR